MDVEVFLHDTVLFQIGVIKLFLAGLGSVIGLPKLEVDGYKERMDHLFFSRTTRQGFASTGFETSDYPRLLDGHSRYRTRSNRT